jgi:hypothetical protein
LAAYLAAGPAPVYIGFGSIVVDNPDAMTKLIFEAVKKAGVRALVSKGWGGLGADALDIPEGVFMLGNVPHDWLFQHVSCVVHHGGAGTTAAGIATGKPTVVVPFFGDQPFWGAMVARAGAGPPPIPYKNLTADKLAAALLEALKPETLERAKELGDKIKEEDGCEVGGKSFHDFLDVDKLRCSLAPSRVAIWRIKRTNTRLSGLAANVLATEGLLDFADLKLWVVFQIENKSLLTFLDIDPENMRQKRGRGIRSLEGLLPCWALLLALEWGSPIFQLRHSRRSRRSMILERRRLKARLRVLAMTPHLHLVLALSHNWILALRKVRLPVMQAPDMDPNQPLHPKHHPRRQSAHPLMCQIHL